MKRLFGILLALFVAGAALAADVDCAGWVSGESGRAGGTDYLCSMTATFTNITEGATTEQSLGFGAQARVTLKYIEVRTTNCANCDVIVQTVTGAAAGRVLFLEDALLAQTIEGTTYSQYLAADVDVDATATSAGGERRLYLRIVNNDAEASNDEDVTVFLVWGS